MANLLAYIDYLQKHQYGRSLKELAEYFEISVRTVQHHLKRLRDEYPNVLVEASVANIRCSAAPSLRRLPG